MKQTRSQTVYEKDKTERHKAIISVPNSHIRHMSMYGLMLGLIWNWV